MIDLLDSRRLARCFNCIWTNPDEPRSPLDILDPEFRSVSPALNLTAWKLEKFKAVVAIDARKVRKKRSRAVARKRLRQRREQVRTNDRQNEKKRKKERGQGKGQRKEKKNSQNGKREGEGIKEGQSKGNQEKMSERKEKTEERVSPIVLCTRGHRSISRGVETAVKRINCVKVCAVPARLIWRFHSECWYPDDSYEAS